MTKESQSTQVVLPPKHVPKFIVYLATCSGELRGRSGEGLDPCQARLVADADEIDVLRRTLSEGDWSNAALSFLALDDDIQKHLKVVSMLMVVMKA